MFSISHTYRMNLKRQISLKRYITPFVVRFDKQEDYLMTYTADMPIQAFVEYNLKVSRTYRNPSRFMCSLALQIERSSLPINYRDSLVTLLSHIALSFSIPLLPLNRTIDMLLETYEYTQNAIIFIVNCRQSHYYEKLLQVYPKSTETCFYLFWALFVLATEGQDIFYRAQFLWYRFQNQTDFYTKNQTFNQMSNHTTAFHLMHIVLLALSGNYNSYCALMRLFCVNFEKLKLSDRRLFYKNLLAADNFDISDILDAENARGVMFDILKSSQYNARLLLMQLANLDVGVLQKYSEMLQSVYLQANKMFGELFVRESLGILSKACD